MVTSASYSYGGFPFGVDLDKLITEAIQVHARTGNYTNLGANATQQNERMAEIINRAVLEWNRSVPDAGQSYQFQIETVAGQVNYDLPTDMQGLSISRVQYVTNSYNGIRSNQEIRMLTRAQLRNLPPYILNGTQQATWPTACSLVEGSCNTEQLTGIVTVNPFSANVDGNGTLFSTELSAGGVIQVYGQQRTVGIVNSNTNLTLTAGTDWQAQYVDEPIYLVTGTAFTNINFYPWPNIDGVLIDVSYQMRPQLVTGDQVANRALTPIMIDSVPTEFQNVVAMRVAIDCLTTENYWERKQMLMEQYPLMLKYAQDQMAAPEAVDNGTASQPGEFNNIVNTDSIFAGMQPAYIC